MISADAAVEAAADFRQSPRLPVDQAGPVFAEPWHAQAFAMAVSLHAAGIFSWADWAAALSREIASEPEPESDRPHAENAAPTDSNNRYYEHWLAALESLLVARRLTDHAQITAIADAWRAAYVETPHGEPVTLG